MISRLFGTFQTPGIAPESGPFRSDKEGGINGCVMGMTVPM